ncbi:aspartate aminotransferase [Rhodococcus sp. 05-340-1]|nr:aspartate aminotransferase [Rhodococcus sp. 06-412-2C]OZC96337.1 aspartate aminotransferase [Rhodococcus sp. 06-412-2B]OZD65320.1 aspartate aminotransferase [Rhodococcus sp. 05-340-2]OZD74633.1 aspartate aminotransferase [Rhodococcus sp. 05-340-1]OZD86593.1 aspartate aminotransferase [Rhodococcus sp. 05-339-2]
MREAQLISFEQKGSGTPVITFSSSDAVRRVEDASLRVQQPQSTGDMVSLAMGEPDFDTPTAIRAAAADALSEGYTHYSPLLGDPELRAAVFENVLARSAAASSHNEVLITHGGTGGLAASILSIVSPGDKVVIPDPTYSLYADLVNLAGGHCVSVPLQDDLHWDLDALAEALQGATLFVFCNPSNPTGIVHSAKELEVLADTLHKSDTIVIADEAYSELIYGTDPFVSALDVPGLADRTVYCQTFSKSYAMTGWRVGYLTGPQEIIAACARVHNTVNGSVNSAVQRAALVALNDCSDEVAAMRTIYAQRRELMATELAKIPGLDIGVSEGAFYFFPRYSVDLPSVQVVSALREHGVALRPGGEFGRHGEGHLRLSYAASDYAITEGVARLGRGLASLR